MRDKENQVSMETVLASIRGMIQDEEKHAYTPPSQGSSRDVFSEERAQSMSMGHSYGPADPTEDVLELHHQIQEDGSVKNIENHGEGGFLKDNALDGWDISSSTMDQFHQAPTISSKAADSKGVEEMVSHAAACAARSSFAKLADTVQEISQEESRPRPHNPTTVEELVLKTLRPMLKEWLDDNLPALAEALVSKEIKKLIQRIRPD